MSTDMSVQPPGAGNGKNPLRIVVTGGGSGIGARMAHALAEDGHALAITGRRAEKLQQVASAHPAIWSHPCDVADEHQVQAFAALVGQRWSAIDALINCAATIGPIGETVGVDLSAFLRVLDVNVCGTLRAIKHMLPLLLQAPKPRIINFAGGGAFGPFPNYSAYAASKAAVVRLTENLAIELAGRRIPVNAVAPGFMPSDMHQATLEAGPDRAGRVYYERTVELLQSGSAEMLDVPVSCVRFLLSPQGEGLTGKTLSAHFDPWDTKAFQRQIPAINQSDLYTQRRINVEHLPDGSLRAELAGAATPR